MINPSCDFRCRKDEIDPSPKEETLNPQVMSCHKVNQGKCYLVKELVTKSWKQLA